MKLKIQIADVILEIENDNPMMENPDGSKFYVHDLGLSLLDTALDKRVRFGAAMQAIENPGDEDGGDTPPAPQQPGTEIRPDPRIEIESRKMYQ